MDITKLKNNKKYNELTEMLVDTEVVLSLKENQEFNIHLWEGYFAEIFGNPIFDNEPWIGFTRDYQEDKGGWEDISEIENIDEYINDMLRYKDRQFRWEETPEVFNLIIDFLTYAKQTDQTVVVEVD